MTSSVSGYGVKTSTRNALLNNFSQSISFSLVSPSLGSNAEVDVYVQPMSPEIKGFVADDSEYNLWIDGCPKEVSFDVRFHNKQDNQVYRSIVKVPCVTPEKMKLNFSVYSNEQFSEIYSGMDVILRVRTNHGLCAFVLKNKKTGETYGFGEPQLSFTNQYGLLPASEAVAGNYSLIVSVSLDSGAWVYDTFDFKIVD